MSADLCPSPAQWHLHDFPARRLFLQQSGTSAPGTSPGSGKNTSPSITSNNTTCLLRKDPTLDHFNFALTSGKLERQTSIAVNNL